MKRSSRKEFEVYEFRDEEQSELLSRKFIERFSGFKKKNLEEFRNPKEEDTSPLRKYQLLKSFSSSVTPQGRRMRNISCIDVDTSDKNHKCKNHSVHDLEKFDGADSAVTEVASGSDEIPALDSTSKEDAHTNPNVVGSGNFFPECGSVSSLGAAASLGILSSGNTEINNNLSELPSTNNPLDVISDDDESVSCSSDIREDQGSLESPLSDHYSDDQEMENNMAVIISPDYLVYKDLYCTDSSLSFSSTCIKLEGVNAYGSKQWFSFEWGIVDVTGIDCRWYGGVETALVKLCVKQITDPETDKTDETSGIVELKFSVCDPHWFDRQEKIISMDVRYEAVWRVLFDSETMEEDAVDQNRRICSKGYYPSFDESFEDVIYPKGDPDAVSISKRDVELLEPETFINDTIIDFYIKYLKSKIRPEERNRFHFFNSFFFRKLADLDKNPSSASEGRAAFLRVRKWTRKVNLFEKDYVFIPVNFNLHWSLIVICHPGEVSTFKDEEVDKAVKVPCILHMDSIKGSHNGLKNLIQSYLREEWKERQPDPSEDVSPNFLNLRFVSLELPQQENSFDCGLFLLHYVERFLEEAPVCFNPFKLTNFCDFLSSDWFPPGEASLKRVYIQELIYDLLQDHSQETISIAHGKECQSFQSMENNSEKNNGIEQNLCNDFSSSPNKEEGIEIKLLGKPDSAHFVEGSGLVLKEFLEPGQTAVLLSNGEMRCVDHLAAINKLKEGGDKGEIWSSPPRAPCGQLVEDICTTSYSLIDFGVNKFTHTETSMRQNEDYHGYSSPEVMCCGSPRRSAEVGHNEVHRYLSPEAMSCGSSQSSGEVGQNEDNLGYSRPEAKSCGSPQCPGEVGRNEDNHGYYSSPEDLGFGSPKRHVEVMIDEHDPVSKEWCLHRQQETETSKTIASENTADKPGSGCCEGLDTGVVEDSQELERVGGDADDNKSNPSSGENCAASPDHYQAQLGGDDNYYSGRKQELADDMGSSELFEKQVAKRARLTQSGGERLVTGTFAKHWEV